MHARSVEYKIGGAFVSIVCVGPIARTEINRFINEIRNTFCGIFMQFITPDVIYGIEHLIGVFKITMESKKRNILIAKSTEMDFLLRLSCTNQISHALKYAGMLEQGYWCIVTSSADKKQLFIASDYVKKAFPVVPQSILNPTKKKRSIISSHIRLPTDKTFLNDDNFAEYLIERAALIIK
ncbi:MAG TPA: KEOPS complex subunit Cgi121 [Nitrososphaeraceae archaeon]|jgi:tRNA threonylcarbamoyladenosine modification (KEOPS) complex Cgi121 subunit|nr:KEOPS complex subunit Cgi121 [Nitrososphaeraceae archaeon]